MSLSCDFLVLKTIQVLFDSCILASLKRNFLVRLLHALEIHIKIQSQLGEVKSDQFVNPTSTPSPATKFLAQGIYMLVTGQESLTHMYMSRVRVFNPHNKYCSENRTHIYNLHNKVLWWEQGTN